MKPRRCEVLSLGDGSEARVFFHSDSDEPLSDHDREALTGIVEQLLVQLDIPTPASIDVDHDDRDFPPSWRPVTRPDGVTVEPTATSSHGGGA